MTATASPAPTRVIRVLVVANDDIDDDDIATLLGPEDPAAHREVLVVTPALNSWMGRLVADAGNAQRDAESRLNQSVAAIRRAGFAASGIVGDADPLLALDDTLTVFAADEVVIASAAAREDGWLGSKLVERARAWCALPVRYAAVAGCEATMVGSSSQKPDGYRAGHRTATGSRRREHRRHPGMERAQRASRRGR
jgi:hypothetical protein